MRRLLGAGVFVLMAGGLVEVAESGSGQAEQRVEEAPVTGRRLGVGHRVAERPADGDLDAQQLVVRHRPIVTHQACSDLTESCQPRRTQRTRVPTTARAGSSCTRPPIRWSPALTSQRGGPTHAPGRRA